MKITMYIKIPMLFVITVITLKSYGQRPATDTLKSRYRYSYYRNVPPGDSTKNEKITRVYEGCRMAIILIMGDTTLKEPIKRARINALIEKTSLKVRGLDDPVNSRDNKLPK